MAIASIQGMRAEANTVAAFNRANARLGGGLRITSPYGAGRERADQEMLRRNYETIGPPAWNYAQPAGFSNHEFSVAGGTALDISNWAAYPDLREVMRQEGFIRDPFEKWHYNYRGVLSPAGNGYVYLNAPGTEEEEDMPLTHVDAQLILTEPIIVEQRWGGQATVATVLAGTRSRAEDTYLQVSALTAAVTALAAAQGIPAVQLASIVSTAVEAKLADDFAAVNQALAGATSGLSDDTFQALATAVADEQDRRARERLGA